MRIAHSEFPNHACAVLQDVCIAKDERDSHPAKEPGDERNAGSLGSTGASLLGTNFLKKMYTKNT